MSNSNDIPCEAERLVREVGLAPEFKPLVVAALFAVKETFAHDVTSIGANDRFFVEIKQRGFRDFEPLELLMKLEQRVQLLFEDDSAHKLSQLKGRRLGDWIRLLADANYVSTDGTSGKYLELHK